MFLLVYLPALDAGRKYQPPTLNILIGDPTRLFATGVRSILIKLNNKYMINNYPGKVQLNYSVRKNKGGEILETSTLINIRSQSPDDCLDLFREIQTKLEGKVEDNEKLLVQFEDEPQDSRKCPHCSTELVQRIGRNGPFMACPRFRFGCKHTENV